MFNSISNDNISLSIREGLLLRFRHKGREVVVHNAAWSFREKIWVDGDLVINELGVRMASTHVLNVAGDAVEVTFGYRKGMTEIFLEARVDDQLIHTISHELDTARSSSILVWLVLGGLAGAALASLIDAL